MDLGDSSERAVEKKGPQATEEGVPPATASSLTSPFASFFAVHYLEPVKGLCNAIDDNLKQVDILAICLASADRLIATAIADPAQWEEDPEEMLEECLMTTARELGTELLKPFLGEQLKRWCTKLSSGALQQ